MRRVLGVLFRYRSIWHKCAACIQRMQYTKGLGLSQQAFCNAKMAFVYTNALLAHATHPFRVLPLYTDRIVSTRTATKVVLKICGSSTLILYMEISFQVHYGHSKGNTPDGEKPKSGNRTLKIEYHSLGQNNETSVTRGPVIKKTGWLKKPMWSGVQVPTYRGVFQIQRGSRTNRLEKLKAKLQSPPPGFF